MEFKAVFVTALLLGGSVILPVGPHRTDAQSSDREEVIQTIDRFHAALESGDSVTVDRLLAEGAVILENGSLETRAEYLSHHLPADMEFAQAVERQRSGMEVQLFGDVASVASTNQSTGQFGDREIDSRGAELMVMVRSGDGWQVSAIHWSSRANRR
jgi:ketosteroid isomerase-like protein